MASQPTRLAWERRAWRRSRGPGYGGLAVGAVFIIVGVLYLLQNLGTLTLNNWWAVFILIPAFGALASAWNLFAAAGRWTSGARGALIAGLLMIVVTAAFLFNLNWGLVLPILLLVGGLAILINVILPG